MRMSETEKSRIIFRELRGTIIKFGIYDWPYGIARLHTHAYCIRYAIR
jgi:hypothetical protein